MRWNGTYEIVTVHFEMTEEEMKKVAEDAKDISSLTALVNVINKHRRTPDMREIDYDMLCRWLMLEGAIVYDKRFWSRCRVLPFGEDRGFDIDPVYKDFICTKPRARNMIIYHVNEIYGFTYVRFEKYKDPIFQAPYTYVRFGYDDKQMNKLKKGLHGRDNFHIIPNLQKQFPYTHKPISVTEFTYRLNCFRPYKLVRECERTLIIRWLYVNGYLARNYRNYTGTKNSQRISITHKGHRFGILRADDPFRYKYNIAISTYTQIQIMNNIESIMSEGREYLKKYKKG